MPLHVSAVLYKLCTTFPAASSYMAAVQRGRPPDWSHHAKQEVSHAPRGRLTPRPQGKRGVISPFRAWSEPACEKFACAEKKIVYELENTHWRSHSVFYCPRLLSGGWGEDDRDGETWGLYHQSQEGQSGRCRGTPASRCKSIQDTVFMRVLCFGQELDLILTAQGGILSGLCRSKQYIHHCYVSSLYTSASSSSPDAAVSLSDYCVKSVLQLRPLSDWSDMPVGIFHISMQNIFLVFWGGSVSGLKSIQSECLAKVTLKGSNLALFGPKFR